MKPPLRMAATIVTAILLVYALAIGSAYYFTLAPFKLQAPWPRQVAAKGRDEAAETEKERAERRNILKQMDRIACEESARFAIEHMPKVPTFPDKFRLFDHCLRSLDPQKDGL